MWVKNMLDLIFSFCHTGVMQKWEKYTQRGLDSWAQEIPKIPLKELPVWLLWAHFLKLELNKEKGCWGKGFRLIFEKVWEASFYCGMLLTGIALLPGQGKWHKPAWFLCLSIAMAITQVGWQRKIVLSAHGPSEMEAVALTRQFWEC